jgi:hypothetical protein
MALRARIMPIGEDGFCSQLRAKSAVFCTVQEEAHPVAIWISV